jgi:predicted dehydrogenase
MSVAAPVRIGLAGAGWVSQHHLEAWRRLGQRVSVVAVAFQNVSAIDARAAAFDIPATYPSVEAMLHAERLDAIDVATPRETHAPICRQAADRGLAIICQKPLAPTLAEAEALVADVGGRVRLMVHENWRFRPHYRRIHQWLRTGRVGEVRTVTMTLLTSGLLPDGSGARPALVRQPMLATLDRLLLMEVLIHHVDTLRFLLGPLTLHGARLGRSCDAVHGEDRASLFLTTAGSASVSIVGDFMACGHPPEQFDRLEILGTSGAITLDRDRLQVRGAIDEDLAVDLAANYKASYVGAFTHFLDRLADGRPFETGPDDNLETLRIIEDAYRIGGPSHSGGSR